MWLDLSDDQELLRATTVRFITTELPIERTRGLHDDPAGYDRGWLRKAAELGWFALLVPEADGGGSVSGDGLVDATIVAEQLGRYVQPGPFLPMNVVASAVAAAGSGAQRARLLPGLVAGAEVATWAWADAAGDWDAGAGLQARRGPDGITLSGTRGVVQDAASADWLLVVATLDDRPVQAVVPTGAAGLTIAPLGSLDLGRRFADVHLDEVAVAADGVLDAGGPAALEAQLQRAVVLLLAETVGAADALLAMTVAYAKDRVAFGRPIGSFQAVKHVLADQALALETCKAAAVAAARAVQSDDPAAAEVVSMAAAAVGERAPEIAQQCLQVHGGIGYTWEHDLHLFLRRIQSNAALYGEASWHRERVCRFHELGSVR
jgi:alkylation response protein AidB-like acyl-CoA dehydrogenase